MRGQCQRAGLFIMSSPCLRRFIFSVSVLLFVNLAVAKNSESHVKVQPVSYKAIKVEDLSIFYREAGPNCGEGSIACAHTTNSLRTEVGSRPLSARQRPGRYFDHGFE